MTLAICVGMAAEAAIVGEPPGASVIIGAGDAAALSAKLEAAIAAGADRVISVGICGGLNPSLRAGDVVVGLSAEYDMDEMVCEWPWYDRLFHALQDDPSPFRVILGRFTWSATAVARLADKSALRKPTGADVVDEESFIAGTIAAAHGLPWATLRVVCDPASFELPPAALTKLTASGTEDLGAILASIAGDPGQIEGLIELYLYSRTAMANLKAALARVWPDFAAT